jgi:LPS export ABC transporter protein LptC
MKERERSLAGLAALMLLVVGGFGCRGEVDPSSMPEEPSRAPNEGMRGIRLRNFQIGDTEWVLEADTASVFRERKTVVAERMTIDFLDGPRRVSRLIADQGVLNQATDDLEARGHVRVTTDDGAVLTTEVLFWDHQSAKIHTEEYVEITQGSDVLAGYGLEADPGLDRVEIRRQVRGTLRSAPDSLLSNTRGAAP